MEGQAELSGKSPEVSLSPPPPESSKKASVGAAQFWVTPSFGVAAPLEPVSEEGEGDAPVAMPAVRTHNRININSSSNGESTNSSSIRFSFQKTVVS